jgi:decaprenylphospho-beta-D-erythro-pentofuranosid-2-ulose 2-reductase
MKLVLILGAKSDMAKATAEFYAKNGWDLNLAGRNIITELSTFRNRLKDDYGCEINLYDLDILDFKSHTEFFKSFQQKPDGVICFIGLLGDQQKSEMDFNETKTVIDSNFTGIVSLLNIFANYFEEKEDGFIVAVSSVAGDRGRKRNSTYGSAKAALTTYLSGLRNRLSPKNVHVMTVIPGFVETKMTKNLDLPSLITVSPNYVGKKIFEMQQRRADQIYIPGYWYFIMAFIKLIPERVFKKLNI